MSTENKAEPLVSPKQLLRGAEEYMRGYLLLQRDSKLPAKTPMSAVAVAGYGAIVSRTYEADRQANLKTIADLRARVEAMQKAGDAMHKRLGSDIDYLRIDAKAEAMRERDEWISIATPTPPTK